MMQITFNIDEKHSRQKITKTELDHKLIKSRPRRELLEELAIKCSDDPKNKNAIYQYGFALSKSKEPSELRYAIDLLDSLVTTGFEPQLNCMYGSATALYLLTEYEEAKTRCEVILHTHPDLPIANELHLACIESIEEQQRETLKKDTVNNIKAAGAGFMGMTNAMLKPPSSLTKNI